MPPTVCSRHYRTAAGHMCAVSAVGRAAAECVTAIEWSTRAAQRREQRWFCTCPASGAATPSEASKRPTARMCATAHLVPLSPPLFTAFLDQTSSHPIPRQQGSRRAAGSKRGQHRVAVSDSRVWDGGFDAKLDGGRGAEWAQGVVEQGAADEVHAAQRRADSSRTAVGSSAEQRHCLGSPRRASMDDSAAPASHCPARRHRHRHSHCHCHFYRAVPYSHPAARRRHHSSCRIHRRPPLVWTQQSAGEDTGRGERGGTGGQSNRRQRARTGGRKEGERGG